MVESSITVRANGIVLDKDNLIPTIQGLLNGLDDEELKKFQSMDITAEAIQNMLTEKMPEMTLPTIDDNVIKAVKGLIDNELTTRKIKGGRKRKRRRTKRKRSKRKYSAKV
jgi:hypothetical protein